jgi:hypothetical protein
MHMAFDSASAFELLRQSYRSGLLDELVAIAGQALDGLIKDTGLGMGDLLAMLDNVSPETVLRAEETAASTDMEEVVAKLAAAVRDADAATAKLQGYLGQAVAKAGASISESRG